MVAAMTTAAEDVREQRVPQCGPADLRCVRRLGVGHLVVMPMVKAR